MEFGHLDESPGVLSKALLAQNYTLGPCISVIVKSALLVSMFSSGYTNIGNSLKKVSYNNIHHSYIYLYNRCDVVFNLCKYRM